MKRLIVRENLPLQPAHIEGYLKMRMFYVPKAKYLMKFQTFQIEILMTIPLRQHTKLTG